MCNGNGNGMSIRVAECRANQRKMGIVWKVHKKVYSLCELDSAFFRWPVSGCLRISVRQLTAHYSRRAPCVCVCAALSPILNEFYLEIKFWFFVWHETTVSNKEDAKCAQMMSCENVITKRNRKTKTKMKNSTKWQWGQTRMHAKVCLHRRRMFSVSDLNATSP